MNDKQVTFKSAMSTVQEMIATYPAEQVLKAITLGVAQLMVDSLETDEFSMNLGHLPYDITVTITPNEEVYND